MKKKFLSVLLAIAMIFSLAIPAMAESSFTDMPNDYSTAALEAAAANGLLKGTDGKILPENELKRAEMAAILVRAFGATKAADLSAFADAEKDSWYYAELSAAVHMGIFKGDGKNMYPNNSITRQEAFLVLSRAFNLKTTNAAALDKFADKASVASWAKDGVCAMVEAGYVNGDEKGNINPLGEISRKDFAVTIDRMVKTYISKAGTVTELPEGSVMINVPNVVLKDVTVKGNLIIGDGVGEGNVTLDNVKVEGATIVRGGGVNSIIVKGNSALGSIIISKVDGKVRVAVEGNAKVEIVEVNDGKDDVIVEGNIAKLEVAASDVPVVVQNASIGEITVSAANSNVTVAASAKVETVTVEKTATKTELVVSGTVSNVTASADNTVVSGKGTVTNVKVEAGNGTTVTTPGAKVEAGKDASNVTAGDKPVTPEAPVEVPKEETPSGGFVPAPRADITVTAENFNTHSGDDYTGVTTGWKLSGTGLSAITSVKVAVYNSADELLVTNTSKAAEKVNTAKQYSCAFPVVFGTYNTSSTWNFGQWAKYDKPSKMVITVTDVNGYTYTAKNETLSEADSVTWDGMFIKTDDQLSAALANANKERNTLLLDGTFTNDITINNKQSKKDIVTLKGVNDATINGKLNVKVSASSTDLIVIEDCKITKAVDIDATNPGEVIFKNNDLTMENEDCYGTTEDKHRYIVRVKTNETANAVSNKAFNITFDNNTIGSADSIQEAPPYTIAFLMNSKDSSNFPNKDGGTFNKGSEFSFKNNKIYLNSLHTLYNVKANNLQILDNIFTSNGELSKTQNSSGSSTATTAITAYNGGSHGNTLVRGNTFSGYGYGVKFTQYDADPVAILPENTFGANTKDCLNVYWVQTVEGFKRAMASTAPDLTIRVLGTNNVLTLDDNVTIPQGKTVEIYKGKTLIIPADKTLTNNGTIVVNDEAGLKTALAVGGTVKLGRDITLTNWQPLGTEQVPFTGMLNGDNHSIIGLKTNLLVYISDATIVNLDLKDVNISGIRNASALANTSMDSTFKNITVSGTISGKAQAGGLVWVAGTADGTTTFENCTNAANITVSGTEGAAHTAGGLVAQIESATASTSADEPSYTFKNCQNSGNITIDAYGSDYTWAGQIFGNTSFANSHTGPFYAVKMISCAGTGEITVNGTATGTYAFRSGDTNYINNDSVKVPVLGLGRIHANVYLFGDTEITSGQTGVST